MIITAHAFARAGLIGNPSDGYFGKTISFVIRNFRATIVLWESPHFEILPTDGDLARFDTVKSYLKELQTQGYYGGMRLIKAAIKRFHDYCEHQEIDLPDRSFTVSLRSDIPRLVGLAGSSAIVVAMMRALVQFHEVHIPDPVLASLAWSAERDELGINCGVQDRVVQTYEGIVYMDLAKPFMEERGYGQYERLNPSKLPPLYLAYDPQRAQISDLPHRRLRERFNQGDPAVVGAMQKYRELTDRAKDALLGGDWEQLGRLMNENFDLRRTIMEIAPENLRMIEAARSTGASAKFAGSGGAICGLYRDGRQYQQLVDALATLRCNVVRSIIFES